MNKTLRQIWYVWQINRILVKYSLDELVFEVPYFKRYQFFLNLLPWNWFRERSSLSRGMRLRLALQDLGPVYVKFGQIVSTRRDLVPDDIANEFALLQDKVFPFPSDEARAIIEAAFDQPISTLFKTFDDQPLASASVAQVHAVTLQDDTQAVVKVIRPNLKPQIKRDISLMKFIAAKFERYSSEAKRLHLTDIVVDFERTIYDELDLMREAANASEMRRHFEGSPLIYVPEVKWPLVNVNAMVLERIYGTPIGEIDHLREQGVNFKVLAERGVEIFFTQVFVYNFFHADMHPGNIYVDTSNPEDPRYIALDFGIMGSLTKQDKRYLAENFMAFFRRDYYRVAKLHIDSGWVPANTNTEELQAAIRTVCEPIFQRPLDEISFGKLIMRLFQTARRFEMEIQPQLILLQKTLLNIEGLGRQLYPNLDLWATAKPFLERAMREEAGLRALFQSLPKGTPEWIRSLPDVPDQMYDLLKRAHNQQISIHVQSQQLADIKRQLQQQHRKLVYTAIGASLWVCAAVVYSMVDPATHWSYANIPLASWITAVVGAVCIYIGIKRFKK